MARTSASDNSRASVTRLTPKLLRQPHAVGVGDAHLRAGVDLQIRRDPARHPDHADVLHDDRVGAGLGDCGERPRGFGNSWSKTRVLNVTYP